MLALNGELVQYAVNEYARNRDWTDSELRRIEAMSDMLGVALANAELVENLRAAESRFRTLFRAAPDAVLTVLQGGDIREANDCARDLTGLEPDALVGRALVDLVAADDRQVLRQALDAAFRGAQARLEIRFNRDESSRLVAVALTGLPDADPPTVLLLGRNEQVANIAVGNLAREPRTVAKLVAINSRAAGFSSLRPRDLLALAFGV